jgi:hypothetical protein
VAKRTVNVREIVQDIRAGMSDAELSAKYHLNDEQLVALFQQLLHTNMVTKGELYGRSSLHPQTVAFQADNQSSKHYLAFPLPIHDAGNPSSIGRVRDLSEGSIGIVGIKAAVNQEKNLVIFPEKFVDLPPVSLEARCTWAAKNASGDYLTRFDITYISNKDSTLLQRLIELLTLGAQEEPH